MNIVFFIFRQNKVNWDIFGIFNCYIGVNDMNVCGGEWNGNECIGVIGSARLSELI